MARGRPLLPPSHLPILPGSQKARAPFSACYQTVRRYSHAHA